MKKPGQPRNAAGTSVAICDHNEALVSKSVAKDGTSETYVKPTLSKKRLWGQAMATPGN